MNKIERYKIQFSKPSTPGNVVSGDLEILPEDPIKGRMHRDGK